MTATKLQAHYVEKIWGRSDIPGAPPELAGKAIGELWFQDGEDDELPLLVKNIYTSEKLSIQVHPDDAAGRRSGAAGGKEECWFVLDAEEGATLGIGTREPLERAALRVAAENGELEALMDWKPVKPGDFYFIPAGTVHAIGAGISLVEVQQNVDITYRLFDYGRPRELHLNDGVAVSEAAPYPRQLVNHSFGQDRMLLEDGPFTVRAHALPSGGSRTVEGALTWFIPLQGSGRIGDAHWLARDCWVLRGTETIVADQDSDFLIASI